MKRIITVQHTQSVHHTNGMVGSWTDWELTETGKRQAYNIASNLKDEFSDCGLIIYSSDLLRAKQTAEIIAQQLNTVPLYKPELRERYLEKCCGQSVQWLRDNIECHEKSIEDKMFSNAESRRDVWNRLKPFFDSMISNEIENIIIVSHGDLLSILYVMFLGLDPEFINNCELYGFAGGVSQMYIDDDQKRYIRRISDMSYLQKKPN